mgnify:CR=1 FL=1
MIDKINFNKRIKYNDIETGSLVWVNFGETKHLFYINLNIVLDVKDFGLTLMKKSTIKLDQLRFIDKTRIVKVERKLISKTLKNLIEKKIQNIFKF